MVDVLCAQVATLAAQQRVLIAKVAQLEQAAHLNESDHDFLTVLWQVYPDQQIFSVRDLFVDSNQHPHLRAAVVGRRPLQIAARLRRLARHPVPGFTLTREDKRDRDGCRWSLLHADDCDAAAGGI